MAKVRSKAKTKTKAKAAKQKPAAVPLKKVDERLDRLVREILDRKEFERPRRETDDDWTIGTLLAIDAPHETVVRLCAKNLGAWHRMKYLVRLCASLPECDLADDTLRRALSSKDEDKRRMALSAAGLGGRVEMAEEIGVAALDTEGGDWTQDVAIDALGALASNGALPPLLQLTKRAKQLERKSPFANTRAVLDSLKELDAKEAEPFFLRYHPPAADVTLEEKDRIFNERLAAWGLARLGSEEALVWLAKSDDENRHHSYQGLCDVLWWSASSDEEYAAIPERFAAHRRGEKTRPVAPTLDRLRVPMDGAIPELNKAIGSAPGDTKARIRRGNLCFDAGLMQRAMHDYAAAVRAGKAANDLAAARLWLTRARFRQREFADAELRRWHRKHGERLDAHRHRLVLHLAGRVSIDELTQGATSPEDTVEAWFFAGARALFLGDAETGRRALERALTAVTKSPTAEQLSARALLEANR